MHPDIENALNEVARDTGRSYRVVEQVFHLQLELARYNAALMMVDGDLTTVSRDGELLPTSLKNEGSSGNRVDESNGKCGLKPHGYWVAGVS
jgi:hypothetical protein